MNASDLLATESFTTRFTLEANKTFSPASQNSSSLMFLKRRKNFFFMLFMIHTITQLLFISQQMPKLFSARRYLAASFAIIMILSSPLDANSLSDG